MQREKSKVNATSTIPLPEEPVCQVKMAKQIEAMIEGVAEPIGLAIAPRSMHEHLEGHNHPGQRFVQCWCCATAYSASQQCCAEGGYWIVKAD